MKNYLIRAIGKVPSDWPQSAVEMYLERLKPLAKAEIIELQEQHGGSAKPNIDATKDKEAQELLKGVPKDAVVIALDEHGRQYDSTSFAEAIENWAIGNRPLVFLIGGSWGLGEEALKAAAAKVSLGKLTLPHALARIVLLEQLYRAEMIRTGKPYHK